MESHHTHWARKDFGAPPSISPAERKPVSGRQYSCLVSDTRVPSLQFCDETNDNTNYEADIAGYLPLLTPKLTKARKVAVRQPNIPKRSVKWWKAQCGFRGLPVGGSLCNLQDRIREHGNKGLSDAMKEYCAKMEEDYVVKNAAAIEKIWIQGDNNQKAKLWPKRFLYESFMEHSKPSKEALVVEVDDWGEKIKEVSRQMKIHCEMRKMPEHKTGQRLVVVGLNEQAVRSKFAEIDRGARLSILRAKQEEEEREKEAQDDFEQRFGLIKSKGRGSKRDWEVSGKWEVRCPYMDENWGTLGDGCSLEIGFTKPTDTGLVQMYASFDFIAITGIMRFVNPDARKDAHEEDNKGRSSRKHELTADEDSDDDSPTLTPAHFLFPNVSLPSYNSRSFNFRWRGEETGEGEIQLYSDRELCSMIFESPNALTGVFISDLTGEVGFKGIRKGLENKTEEGGLRKRRDALDRPDPNYAWRSRSEAAHERARIGRWR